MPWRQHDTAAVPPRPVRTETMSPRTGHCSAGVGPSECEEGPLGMEPRALRRGPWLAAPCSEQLGPGGFCERREGGGSPDQPLPSSRGGHWGDALGPQKEAGRASPSSSSLEAEPRRARGGIRPLLCGVAPQSPAGGGSSRTVAATFDSPWTHRCISRVAFPQRELTVPGSGAAALSVGETGSVPLRAMSLQELHGP